MTRKGYWIVHVNITNPERYKDYVAANAVAFRKYNGRFLVRGGEPVVTRGGALGATIRPSIRWPQRSATKPAPPTW